MLKIVEREKEVTGQTLRDSLRPGDLLRYLSVDEEHRTHYYLVLEGWDPGEERLHVFDLTTASEDTLREYDLMSDDLTKVDAELVVHV